MLPKVENGDSGVRLVFLFIYNRSRCTVHERTYPWKYLYMMYLSRKVPVHEILSMNVLVHEATYVNTKIPLYAVCRIRKDFFRIRLYRLFRIFQGKSGYGSKSNFLTKFNEKKILQIIFKCWTLGLQHCVTNSKVFYYYLWTSKLYFWCYFWEI